MTEVKAKSLSYYLRYLTANKLVELTGITNTTYIIISIIIFILFFFRVICYTFLRKFLKAKKYLPKCYMILYRFLNILEHLVYLLYPILFRQVNSI